MGPLPAAPLVTACPVYLAVQTGEGGHLGVGADLNRCLGEGCCSC